MFGNEIRINWYFSLKITSVNPAHLKGRLSLRLTEPQDTPSWKVPARPIEPHSWHTQVYPKNLTM